MRSLALPLPQSAAAVVVNAAAAVAAAAAAAIAAAVDGDAASLAAGSSRGSRVVSRTQHMDRWARTCWPPQPIRPARMARGPMAA